MEGGYYVGVDVGSSSVRAALVTPVGRPIKTHSHPIAVNNPQTDYYEQDSEEIWAAVCACVKAVTQEVPDKGFIQGLGFTGTCSLVVLDHTYKPVCVSPTGADRFNVVMWMDHRASDETEEINSRPHRVLRFVGGRVSPEMQTPKLLWLKRHMTKSWVKAGHFFDLPDYLTFKATGSLSRSLCSLTCKWTYVSSEGSRGRSEGERAPGSQSEGWDEEYFRAIGLEDLADEHWARIGQEVKAPGDKCGTLTQAAAHMMGLNAHTPVAASLIDAHAGGLALAAAGLVAGQKMTGRLGLVCGTSTCHMVLSASPVVVGGVWGPYGGAVLPQTHLGEGGISASGALIDHLIESHPSAAAAAAAASAENKSVYGFLEEVLEEAARNQHLSSPSLLTPHLHLYPDFHGNRSPLADPHMTGMVTGLTLDSSVLSLALLYLSAIQALAYGTRHILHHMRAAGHQVTDVLMCGGLCASRMYVHTHADVLGVKVLVPQYQPSVLLGAAMLGAAASGRHPSLEAAARAMGGPVEGCQPREDLKEFHDKKYQVFLKMQQDQMQYRKIMSGQVNTN